MEQFLGWLCFSNQELGAEDFGVGQGMAQLIEGNLKVNKTCGADIKVKGKKIKKKMQSPMIQRKWRSGETQQKGKVLSISMGKKLFPRYFPECNLQRKLPLNYTNSQQD